ncbi:MAG TPA: metal ABC transporter ATP-binding protein [Gemmataceae bacterium]|nr:metal ABC transporter ATP-binding protein [Gemmataceae bacterium]
MSSALITIRNLRVQLGGNPILRGMSCEIERGKITALIGLNGSGKTTLLRAILKEAPYVGQIQFHCGHDHSKPTPEHIGYVPQKLNIDVRLPLTVRDLLALAIQHRPLFLGVSRKTQPAIDRMLQRVWADPALLDRFVEKISGGELQRVLLGLALHPEPELLLLDEPAQGLDYQTDHKFYELIADLNRKTGVTVLLVSHDFSIVSVHAHHVLCLNDGCIQCQGTPHETLTGEVLERVFGADKSIYEHAHSHGRP